MAEQAAGEVRQPQSAGGDPAKPARFQIGLARGLVFGFGGLVLLAVVAVLALGFSSARQNTLDLLGDKSASTIQLIVDRIDQHLRPVENQLDHLGRRIDNGEIDLGDDADLGKALAGALAATPHVRSVVFIHADAREATVMFTDIVAFTRQSETMTAPETAEFLNQHFAMFSRCVEDEDGTIDKFIGDSLMAFWGAPEAQPDHAARACRAALAIRAAVIADNQARVREGGDPVRVHIGVHTGEVIVGNIGAPGRINYTIVGDTVNTANRLEQLGKEIDEDAVDTVILASAATTAAASVEARALGAHPIRGRQEELEVFAL